MKHRLHPKVKEDLREARAYFESCAPGLVTGFWECYKEALRRVLAHPTSHAFARRGVHRCRLRKFRYYAVFLRVRPRDLYILTLSDLRRGPDYRLDRLCNGE